MDSDVYSKINKDIKYYLITKEGISMKILVIFTGGTIGSKAKNGWISTDNSTSYSLINSYNNNKNIIFDSISPYTVLSENLSSKELNILQKEISSHLNSGYNGIIVTHGTDTLQYSACAAEYAFSSCKIPIVFVSAAYPLDNEKTNGNINFEAAVEFICSTNEGGVFVSYKNENEAFTSVHIPTKILQHQETSSDIYSINNSIYATYDGNIKLNSVTISQNKGVGVSEYKENPGILVIESHPGDGYMYSLNNVKAVILKPYHSATLNTSSKSFQEFCLLAKNKNIPIFAVNINQGICYESTSLFNDLGIISLPYCTFISAYMKLWLALSLKKDVVEFMKTNLTNEYLYI